nr:RNA-dependent RNA polymerase [Tolivirales sp.]
MGQHIVDDNLNTHNNSVANLLRGVGERVLYTDRKLTTCAQPLGGVFEGRLASYKRRIVRSVGRQSPVTRDQFVEFYKGPRRATYERAVASLVLKPICSRDARLKTFVKAEKINFTLKEDPAPRVIQPREPRFNVEVGRYLRPIEHKVYDAVDDLFGSPTIMSKYNSVQTANIIHDKFSSIFGCAVVGLDASRFDQHVSEQALKFEHSVYDGIFNSGELRWLLKHQLHNYGFAKGNDGWFKYQKKGSRMSGDMNTSLGNKLLMCMMCKSYLDGLNVPYEFVNNGDDCLVFLARKHLPKLNTLDQYFNDFGFKMKCEPPVFEVEQIEFCQCKPVLCNGIWRMTRNVRTALAKDCTSVNLGHDIELFRRWLHDVSACGAAFSADLPVLGSFYRMLGRFGVAGEYEGHKSEFAAYRSMSKGVHIPYTTPDAQGRYSFWLSTGINPEQQETIEQYFDTAVWGGDKRQIITNIDYIITHGRN